MAAIKNFFILIVFLLAGLNLQAELQMQDIYGCLAPISQLEYMATIEKQNFSYDETKSKNYPDMQFELAKEYNATNSPSTSTSAFAKLSISQKIYDRKLNSEINAAEALKNSARYFAAESKTKNVQLAVESLFDYYLAKEKYKIIEQKIERQTSLISVLNDMVSAKSTDGVLLTLSQSDLALLKIKLSEIALQIQRYEKSLFVSEKLRKMIADNTIYNLAAKIVDQRNYLKLADKSLLLFWEYNKKEIEFKNLSLTDSLLPKINFGVDYFSYFEDRDNLRPKDDFLINFSLTFPFSDVYTLNSQKANNMKSMQLAQMSLDKLRFDLNASDQFKTERVKQISQSIKNLYAIKLNVIKAKDVISKKLLLNKASYSDYVQIDDRLDGLEEQISSNQIEKIKILLFNEIEILSSDEAKNAGLTCNL